MLTEGVSSSKPVQVIALTHQALTTLRLTFHQQFLGFDCFSLKNYSLVNHLSKVKDLDSRIVRKVIRFLWPSTISYRDSFLHDVSLRRRRYSSFE